MRKKPGYVFPDDLSGQLFNYLRDKFKLADDSELSERIGIARSIISKIRTGKRPLSSNNMLQINTATGLSLKKIRELIAGGE